MSSSRGALFSSGSGGRQSKNLVEFRAGKMTQKGKMVHPDKRKGLLYVNQSEDSLIHLCWKDRQSGTVEDDLIIFPDDCEFKRVTQCTTGRVYVLKFKSSNRLFFFWMQEPKTDKDDDLCKKVNEVLNNPPTPGSSRSGGGTPADGDLQSLLNTMSQQQLMQFFGNVGHISNLSSLLGPTAAGGRPTSASRSSSASGTTTASSGGSSKLASDTSAKTTSSEPKAPEQQQPQESNVDLAGSLTVENLQAMLADPATVRELQKHLPALGETGAASESEQLRTTLQSPQFQQAVTMFSAALQSGQLGPVVQQFGVGSDAVNAANRGDLEEFVRALQKANKGEESPKDDEEME